MTPDYAPEIKIQYELLKRALDASRVASSCVDEVYAPLCATLTSRQASVEDVQATLEEWLTAWQEVRTQCDSYLKRNREHFAVRPSVELSPALVQFEERLVAIYEAEDLDAPAMLFRTREATDALAEDLRGFEEWARKAGPQVGLNVVEYGPVATNRAKRFWQPNVRAIEKMMQQGG